MSSNSDASCQEDGVDGAISADETNINSSNNTMMQGYACEKNYKLYYDSSPRPNKVTLVPYKQPEDYSLSRCHAYTDIGHLSSWSNMDLDFCKLTDNISATNETDNDDIEIFLVLRGGEIKVEVGFSDLQGIYEMAGIMLASSVQEQQNNIFHQRPGTLTTLPDTRQTIPEILSMRRSLNGRKQRLAEQFGRDGNCECAQLISSNVSAWSSEGGHLTILRERSRSHQRTRENAFDDTAADPNSYNRRQSCNGASPSDTEPSMKTASSPLKHHLDFNKTSNFYQYHGTGDNNEVISNRARRTRVNMSQFHCDTEALSYRDMLLKGAGVYGDAATTKHVPPKVHMSTKPNNVEKLTAPSSGHGQKMCIDGTRNSRFYQKKTDRNKGTTGKSNIVSRKIKATKDKISNERTRNMIRNVEGMLTDGKINKWQKTNYPKRTDASPKLLQLQIQAGSLKSMLRPELSKQLRAIQLLEKIHEGLYSTKYRAKLHRKSSQRLVLSVYSDQDTSDIDIDKLIRMRNSNVINVLKDCIIGERQDLWLQYFYYPLGSLGDLVRRDPRRYVIGEMHAQFVTCGVLMGLEYLLKHRVVHGNIKPSKILISHKGYPILTGFLAVRSAPGEDTRAVFTPAYAAPERFEGNLEPGVDIFSLGCLAYELVTSKPPFEGNTMEDTKANLTQTKYRPFFKAELFSLSGELFIGSCLRRCPYQRFQLRENESTIEREEWFSTLDLRDMKQQSLPSPLLKAIRQIETKVKLHNDEKLVQYNWGRNMDVVCPDRPTLAD